VTHIRKIFFISIVFILIFVLAKEVSGSTVFFDMEFSKLGTAKVMDFRFTETDYETFFSDKGIGEYGVKILDKSNNVLYSEIFGGVDFTIQVNTENGVITKEMNSTTKNFRLLLPENSYSINFYKNEQQILSISLPDYICNNNLQCETDKGESEYLCPQDCPVEKPKTPIYVYIIIVLAIIAIIIGFLYKMKIGFFKRNQTINPS
jgi:hypothetical protein